MTDATAPNQQSDRAAMGCRLRRRRKALGLTMQDVADNAGLSIGFISQIERGLAAPSLSSLVSVARVLRAEVSSFLDQPRGENSATRKDQRPVYSVADSALSYERVSASFPGNVLRSVIIHEPPGYRSEPISHEGEEMFYIISGATTVEVEGERTILEAGDTIHFASTRRHSTWNHTDQPVTILHTCTMDVFGDEDFTPQDVDSHSRVVIRRQAETGLIAPTKRAANSKVANQKTKHSDNPTERT